MPNYRFSEISFYEFEELCRDLLQAEFGITLELFSPGPDQGIDIRYYGVEDDASRSFIAQCKRWDERDYAGLLSHLERLELPKIQKLASRKYILMTSVRLNPRQKDEIVAKLQPWIRAPGDIYGKEDISGLLARHKEVERRHIKLWLTSTEVLDALLNSDTFNRSEDALERAERQLRLWVPNPSFVRAREVLEANRVCVISGPPGIGKSMLADVLSAGYVSSGYQLVWISEDIEEGDRAWRPNRRQVFLYDDFLGHVTYGELHLRKNEQSRLARFIDRVGRSEGKRFILTTREYILSEALKRYERLAEVAFDDYKNVISLQDYTLKIRAEILYNHLFFSELPSKLKQALLPRGRYWDVIRHRNYNPRVIEHAVSLPGVSSKSPEEFESDIFDTLEDPTAVWGRIFDNLSPVARHIMLAMTGLPDAVFLDDLRRAVEGLSTGHFDSADFRNAVSMVEGTFIELKQADPRVDSHQRIVEVRDPSIRDFLWARLETLEGEAEDLLQNALYFEQCIVLYEGRNHVSALPAKWLRGAMVGERTRNVVNADAVVKRALELLESSCPIVSNYRDRDSHVDYFKPTPVNMERRVAFIMSLLAAYSNSRVVASAADSAFETLIEAWNKGRRFPSEALDLFDKVNKIEAFSNTELIERAKVSIYNMITSSLHGTDDFEALVDLFDLSPDLFGEPYPDIGSWSTQFSAFLENEKSWLLDDLDDPDWLEEETGKIAKVARIIGVDTSELESEANRRIDNLRSEWDPDDEDNMPEYSADATEKDSESVEAEIDSMFRSLL